MCETGSVYGTPKIPSKITEERAEDTIVFFPGAAEKQTNQPSETVLEEDGTSRENPVQDGEPPGSSKQQRAACTGVPGEATSGADLLGGGL